MKKRTFILVLIGLILGMVAAFTLQCFFGEITSSFGLFFAGLFLAVFSVCGYRYALNPRDRFVINRTKRYYEQRGELSVYKRICGIAFFVSLGIAALFFQKGIWDVLLHYIKLWLAN